MMIPDVRFNVSLRVSRANALVHMDIALNLFFKSGMNLNIIDIVSPRTGAALPNRYISLSAVIITLKQLNQMITETSITAAHMPYTKASIVILLLLI